MRASFVVFAAFVLGFSAAHAEDTWELRRDRDDIQVYTRAVEGSKHKEVKTRMTVAAPLNALIGLVLDTDACPRWAALCKSSYVAESVSPTEAFVYTYNDLPWPVTDRDAIGHVHWSMAEDGSVTMRADIVADKLPRTKKVIRLTTGVTSWTFKPNADGTTEVISHAHLDPGGAVPSWITNMLLVDSPFDTMKNMRELAESGEYQDTSLDFLTASE